MYHIWMHLKKGPVSMRRLALQEHDLSAAKMKNSDSLGILFKPTRIGGVDLRNRIAMAPNGPRHVARRRAG